MENRYEQVDPQEIIDRLQRIIAYLEKKKLIANNDEKDIPITLKG